MQQNRLIKKSNELFTLNDEYDVKIKSLKISISANTSNWTNICDDTYLVHDKAENKKTQPWDRHDWLTNKLYFDKIHLVNIWTFKCFICKSLITLEEVPIKTN